MEPDFQDDPELGRIAEQLSETKQYAFLWALRSNLLAAFKEANKKQGGRWVHLSHRSIRLDQVQWIEWQYDDSGKISSAIVVFGEEQGLPLTRDDAELLWANVCIIGEDA